MSKAAYRETKLLNQLASGDPAAFTIIYNECFQRIYHYARTFLADKEDAEDVTADTFVKLWNRRDCFESLAAIQSFLHATARNSSFDFLRHSKVKAEKQEELIRQIELHDNSYLQQTRNELLNIVQKEVAKMSARMKEIYNLSYKEGLTPAEIAEALNISAQTVSNQKTTVIRILKKAFVHPASASMIIALIHGVNDLHK